MNLFYPRFDEPPIIYVVTLGFVKDLYLATVPQALTPISYK